MLWFLCQQIWNLVFSLCSNYVNYGFKRKKKHWQLIELIFFRQIFTFLARNAFRIFGIEIGIAFWRRSLIDWFKVVVWNSMRAGHNDCDPWLILTITIPIHQVWILSYHHLIARTWGDFCISNGRLVVVISSGIFKIC